MLRPTASAGKKKKKKNLVHNNEVPKPFWNQRCYCFKRQVWVSETRWISQLNAPESEVNWEVFAAPTCKRTDPTARQKNSKPQAQGWKEMSDLIPACPLQEKCWYHCFNYFHKSLNTTVNSIKFGAFNKTVWPEVIHLNGFGLDFFTESCKITCPVEFEKYLVLPDTIKVQANGSDRKSVLTLCAVNPATEVRNLL